MKNCLIEFKSLNIKDKTEVLKENFKICLTNTFPLAECIEISLDRKYLLTGHQDGTIRKWDLQKTGKDCIVASHRLKIQAICLNKRYLISSGQDSKVKIWKMPEFDEVFSIDIKVNCFCKGFGKDGFGSLDGFDKFCAGSEDGDLYKFELMSNDSWTVGKEKIGNCISALVDLDDGDVFVGCEDGQGWIVSESLERIGEVMMHGGSVQCALKWTDKIITGSMDKFVRIFKIQSQELLFKYETKISFFLNLAIYQDYLIITTFSKSLLILSFSTFELIQNIEFKENIKCSLLFNNFLFYTGSSRNLRTFNLTTMSKDYIITGHKSNVTSIVLSNPHKIIASGGRDHTIRIWDLETSAQIHILYGHSDLVRYLRFTCNNSTLASLSDDKTLKIWDIQSETFTYSVPVSLVMTKLSSNLGFHNDWLSFTRNDFSYQLLRIGDLTKTKKISRRYLLLLAFHSRNRII